ncbi:hypothetical protein MMC29_002004 [Sticta canariensis]|nr:hypothetical protein [Sticta canariensis]
MSLYYSHSNGPHRPYELKITFMSYSMRKGEPRLPIPVLQRFPCHELEPPDRYILNHWHGLDPELAHAFFANPDNEDAYQENVALLQSSLHRVPQSVTHVAVLTSCRAGMHRSVAMAERLAQEVGRWHGVRVKTCKHYDLEESIRSHEERGHGPYSF